MTTADVPTPRPLSDYWTPEEGIPLTELVGQMIIIRHVEMMESETYGRGARAEIVVEDGAPDFEPGREYLTYTFAKSIVEALEAVEQAFRADPLLAKRGVIARVLKEGRRYVLR